MPPPLPKPALLPLIVLLLTISVPPSLSIPPPLLLVPLLVFAAPPVTVSAFSVTCADEESVNTCTLPPPLIVTDRPLPSMVRFLSSAITPVSVMVPLQLKLTVSPAAAFVIALRRWLSREAYAMLEQTIARARRYHAERPTSAPLELGEGELVQEAEWLAHLWLFGFSLYFEDYAGGRAHVEEALRLCQSLRKRRGEVFCLSSLAMIDFYTGDDAAARQRYERVLPLARALDDSWAEMRVRRELSEVLRVQGAYGPAHALLGAVVTVAQDLDIWYEETWAVAALVRLHCQVGDVAGAGPWHDHLVRLLGRAGLTPDCEAAALRASALYALHCGERQQALADAEHAARLTEQHDFPTFRAEAAVILGHAWAALRQPSAAAAAFEQALHWYAICGNAVLTREPRAALAQIVCEKGDLDGARTLVERLVPGLAEPARAAVLTPGYADLIVYRVLAAIQDTRAPTVLRTARQRLHAAADQLDGGLRHSFLENVAAHRELLHADAAWDGHAR